MRTVKGLLVFLLLAFSLGANAETFVPVFKQSIHPALHVGDQAPLAMRILVDGSILTLDQDLSGLSAVRYDSSGRILSTVTTYTGWTVAPDVVGGVVAGTSREGSVIVSKHDAVTGRSLWAAPWRFDDPLARYFRVVLALDPSGDVIVAATPEQTQGTYDIVIAKLDGATGAPRWGSPVHVDPSGAWFAVTGDSAGDVFLSTAAIVSDTEARRVTTKLSGANGVAMWSSEETTALLESCDANPHLVVANGAVVVGWPNRLTKVNAVDGRTLWTVPVSKFVVDVKVDANGDVFSTGAETMKYDGATGTPAWGSPSTAGQGAALALAGNGDVVVTGDSTFRLDGRTGRLVWKAEPLSPYSGTSQVAVDAAGRVVVSGSAFQGTSWDAATQVFDGSSGAALWSSPAFFTGNANGSDEPVALAVDAMGNITVTSTSYYPLQGWLGWPARASTARLRGTEGLILWTNVSEQDDQPTSLGVDASANVFVTGALTRKLDASDGSVRWAKALSDGIRRGYGRTLDVDRNGDVVVAGPVFEDDATTAVVTRKYHGVDGSDLWSSPPVERVPWPGNASPRSLSVDSAGNAFVLTNIGLFKYAGTTGQRIWQRSASATLGMSSFGLRLGPTGDPVAVGFTFDSSIRRAAALRLDGTTGEPDWPSLFAISLSSSTPSVGLEAAGDVFLAGLQDLGATRDVAVFKVNASTGSAVWQATPAYPNGNPTRSIGLDSHGDAVVALTRSSTSSTEVALAKYEGSTGQEIVPPAPVSISAWRVYDMKMLNDDPVLLMNGLDDEILVARFTTHLAIETLPDDIAPARCGAPYSRPLVARNGTPPYQWNVVSGALPPGLILDRDRQTGDCVIAGVPTATGVFTFQIRVKDSATPHKAEFIRDYTIVVNDAGSVTVTASANPVCLGSASTLSVPGPWSSFRWLPGGEPTSTLDVSPSNPTTYGVVVTDAGGCTWRGAITVGVAPPGPRVEAPAPVVVSQTICGGM